MQPSGQRLMIYTFPKNCLYSPAPSSREIKDGSDSGITPEGSGGSASYQFDRSLQPGVQQNPFSTDVWCPSSGGIDEHVSEHKIGSQQPPGFTAGQLSSHEQPQCLPAHKISKSRNEMGFLCKVNWRKQRNNILPIAWKPSDNFYGSFIKAQGTSSPWEGWGGKNRGKRCSFDSLFTWLGIGFLNIVNIAFQNLQKLTVYLAKRP